MKYNLFTFNNVNKKIPGYQGSYVPMRDGLNEVQKFFFDEELEICEKRLTKHVRQIAIRKEKKQNMVWTAQDILRDSGIVLGFGVVMMTIIGLLSIWMV